MKVVSWNVNSIRKRMQSDESALPRLLKEHRPDVVCLQELQCKEQQVARTRLMDAGYDALVCAQKGKNGVAILTHKSLGTITPAARYPWPPSGAAPSVGAEARLLAADVHGVIVASVYAPFGRGSERPQWQEKLDFFSALKTWAWQVISQGQCLLLAGDFNVAPSDADVHVDPLEETADPLLKRGPWPEAWSPWCHAQMRQALCELLSMGLIDLGAKAAKRRATTMFDERNFGRGTASGVRVDLFLASLPMAARLREMTTLSETRGWMHPSDHCPVAADFIDLHRVFACFAGSRLHGTSLPHSDIDIKGIVLPSVKDFYLGRGCKKEVVVRDKPAGERNNAFDVDTSFMTPLDFVDMLASGQPVAWEMLFAPDEALLPDTTPLGRAFVSAIRAQVPQLLTRDTTAVDGAVKQYMRRIERELSQQLHQGFVQTDTVQQSLTAQDSKKITHAVRVLQQADELLRTQALILPRPNAAYLREIKQNQRPLAETLQEIERARAALSHSAQSSERRLQADRRGAEDAIARLIGGHLRMGESHADAA